MTIYQVDKKPHCVTIEVSDVYMTSSATLTIVKWCKDNLQGKWSRGENKYIPDTFGGKFLSTWLFVNAEDAMLFKLTWG